MFIHPNSRNICLLKVSIYFFQKRGRYRSKTKRILVLFTQGRPEWRAAVNRVKVDIDQGASEREARAIRVEGGALSSSWVLIKTKTCQTDEKTLSEDFQSETYRTAKTEGRLHVETSHWTEASAFSFPTTALPTSLCVTMCAVRGTNSRLSRPGIDTDLTTDEVILNDEHTVIHLGMKQRNRVKGNYRRQ